MPTEPLLAIEGLSVNLGYAAVVRDLSLPLEPGEMLELIGEQSACHLNETVA